MTRFIVEKLENIEKNKEENKNPPKTSHLDVLSAPSLPFLGICLGTHAHIQIFMFVCI